MYSFFLILLLYRKVLYCGWTSSRALLDSSSMPVTIYSRTTHWAFYNEIIPYCAEWLRNLIRAGLLPRGYVDERPIQEIHENDLEGFTQCHWFAGAGGWPLALRQSGWPDSRPIWTASCPCQPFSVAGKGKGTADARHLWPDLLRLILASRPSDLLGEQVGLSAGRTWFGGVRSDLEAGGYRVEGLDAPACAVNAPQLRNRIWWGAARVDERTGGSMAYPRRRNRADDRGRRNVERAASANQGREEERERDGDAASDAGAASDKRMAYSHDPQRRSTQPGRDNGERETSRREEGDGDVAERRGRRKNGVSGSVAHSPLLAQREPQHAVGSDARNDARNDASGDSAGPASIGVGDPRPPQSPHDEQSRIPVALQLGSRDSSRSTTSEPSRGPTPNYWDSSVLIGPDRYGLYRRIKPRPLVLASGLPRLLAPPRSYRSANVLAPQGARRLEITRSGVAPNAVSPAPVVSPVSSEPISPLAPRTPVTADQLSAFGNSLCIPLATEVARAWREARDEELANE